MTPKELRALWEHNPDGLLRALREALERRWHDGSTKTRRNQRRRRKGAQ